jgi:hypothetical protein
LTDEIRAVAGLPIGIMINWGRSAIELRDPDRVVDHVRQAREAGVLEGIEFSGVDSRPSLYGDAWADQHPPFRPDGDRVGHDGSLLTAERARTCLDEAGEVDFVAVKFNWHSSTPSVNEWATVLGQWAEFVGTPMPAAR